MLSAAGAAPVFAAGSIVNQPFNTDSTSGWTNVDDACLTAGDASTPGTSIPSCTTVLGGAAPPVDASGSGTLLLTTDDYNQDGLTVYTPTLTGGSGLQAVFTDYAFGGGPRAGADGVSFFFLDGSQPLPAGSFPGGGLGYVNITGAYLGVGIA
ncbi:MAG TPA: hypothetical protein VGD50_00250, partial [Candidatus Baltobacteraceae bacterium]